MAPSTEPRVAKLPETSAAPGQGTALLSVGLLRALAAQLSISCGFSLYFLMPKYLSTQFHAGAFAIGSLSATALGAAVVTTPLTGAALDRFGRRGPMLLGALLVVFSSLGMTSVTSIGAAIYAWRVLQGVGFALGYNGAAACVADVAAPQDLGRAMSLLGASSLLTNAAAPALGESVAARFGWSPVFALAAATGVVTMVIVATLPTRERAARVPSAPTEPGSLAFSRIGLITFVNGAAFGTLITFALPFALAQGAVRVTGYLVGYTLGALTVRLAFGSVADKLGRKRVASFSLLAYGLVALSTAWMTPRFLLLFGVGFGVAHGLLYPTLAAMSVEGCSPDRRGRRLSAFGAAFNLGAGVALIGSGWVARSAGYPAAFLTVGALTVLSMLAFSIRHGQSHAVS